jgi:hypothetical protein
MNFGLFPPTKTAAAVAARRIDRDPAAIGARALADLESWLGRSASIAAE